MEKNEYNVMYKVEDTYWWYRGLHHLVMREIKKAELSDSCIFDAGCGTGKLLTLLRSCGSVSGIDYADDAVQFCRQRGLDMVVQQDLNDWTPESSLYDVITSIDVVCCREVTSDAAFFQKAFAALKPNGILILNLPAFDCMSRMHDVAVHIGRRYRLKPLCSQLKQAGFSIAVASYRLPLLFVVILGVRLCEALSGKRKVESDLKPVPAFINNVLLLMHKVENVVITHGVRVPFGSSVFVVARKPFDKKG